MNFRKMRGEYTIPIMEILISTGGSFGWKQGIIRGDLIRTWIN